MPFRVFAAGEVLTAANVNDYLAEQAISTFAGTAARASAITAPTEGQFAYLSDSDSLTFYNGSTWVNAGSAIAGTALSSGTATSGQVLTANGSGGVSFSNGGLTLINTTTFSAVSSVSLPANSFTTTYDKYLVLLESISSSTTVDVNFRMRLSGTDNTSTEYSTQILNVETTNVTAARTAKATSTVISRSTTGRSISQITLFNPANAVFTQVDSSVAFYSPVTLIRYSALHEVATAYDSMTFIPGSGTFTGNVQVYGFNK